MEEHYDCKVVVSEEETIIMSFSCDIHKVVTIRGHEVFLVVTHFSDSCLLKHCCITVKYVGPKHKIQHYKYEVNVDGVYSREIMPDRDYSTTNPGMIREIGGHIHVLNILIDVSFPAQKLNYSVKTSTDSQ
jgi:hypothetical protein